MWSWLVENKQWVFSGIGVSVIATIIWFVKKFWPKHQPPTPSVSVSTTQSPNITVSPVFNLHERTELLKQGASPRLAARANLRIESIGLAKIYLRGDIWTTDRPVDNDEISVMGLIADVTNLPTPTTNIKAIELKAVLTIQSRNYTPLPWLEEYINVVRLEPAARKSVVLAVGSGSPLEPWYFLLNQRDQYFTPNEPSRMDWSNVAPIPSNLPMSIMFVDIDSGEMAAEFKYIWTFDSGRPFLRPPS